MNTLTVGILFGGISEEHNVSVKSAREVAKNLDLERYEPVWIGITSNGNWLLCDGPEGDWETRTQKRAVVSPDRDVRGLLVIDEGGVETIRLDVILPVLHGTLGEDGAVQGLFELAGIPYVGCDIQSSVICMDKSLAYTVASSAGIATPAFHILHQGEQIDGSKFDYPVYVKPARSGSSFGVSKVDGPDGLQDAIDTARKYDVKVLIEQAVVGSEIGCSILGVAPDLFIGESDRVALSHGFFRIHQEATPETGSENSIFIVPADISPSARAVVHEAAKAVYVAFGCRGIARVDMFLTEDGTPVLNEVNTLPGLTSYSRYPRMMAAAGVSLRDVLTRAITLALSETVA
ncbi:D-alanine--(R)-lactate ligase [Rathayibacter toxicus]|uniref:D-alanine--D-alanine ligase n=2 Tax=Rathayibacter toxicus TaxID=145458 RepID=A0A0C5B8G0_9MICO|nr:D-alanine--(R)-lactate ligase [Rathayibacter toxicus]AJM77023.1 D-alanine--D-alanine ligase [Rathayibacter toxicus]ALS57173.1 D-alanine--D-alanine ligase [Rathayibacter toxicus]KKM46023.1 D-alanine--D-alanine ligase [Rathayibacter toxicus]PPG22953.1 D-alanine--(R)-lactate ligase [Rathayibacter toxicus]PPG47534.1 D-alanine--(R)-lactate ligase [Rathayibacter toxicus]